MSCICGGGFIDVPYGPEDETPERKAQTEHALLEFLRRAGPSTEDTLQAPASGA